MKLDLGIQAFKGFEKAYLKVLYSAKTCLKRSFYLKKNIAIWVLVKEDGIRWYSLKSTSKY